MEFKCDLIKEGIPTVNGRTYSKEALERVANQSLGVLVQLGNESRSLNTLELEKCLGDITACEVRDGSLVADIRFFDTDSAKLAKALIDGGISLSDNLMPILIAEVDKDGNPILQTIETIGYSVLCPKQME